MVEDVIVKFTMGSWESGEDIFWCFHKFVWRVYEKEKKNDFIQSTQKCVKWEETFEITVLKDKDPCN